MLLWRTGISFWGTKMINEVNSIIPLNDDNISLIKRRSIIGYVLVSADFYTNDRDVYIFVIENVVSKDSILKVYRGQLHNDLLHENSLYKLIPETQGFFDLSDFSDKTSKHPEGWKYATFLIGYYCFFPERIATAAESQWIENCTKYRNKELLLIKGILESCIQFEKEVVSATADEDYFGRPRISAKTDDDTTEKICVTNNILCKVLSLYPDSWKNPKQFKNLLADMLPENKLQRNLIYLSLVEHIPDEIIEYKVFSKSSAVRLKKRLMDAYAWSDSVAAEIINMWAEAFGIRVEEGVTLHNPSNKYRDVTELGLSYRTIIDLAEAGIRTVSKLIALSKEDIKSKRHFDKKSMIEIIDKLQSIDTSDDIIMRYKQAYTEQLAESHPTNIEKLHLNKKTETILTSAGIYTLGELIIYTENEIHQLDHLGERRLKEIKSALQRFKCDFLSSDDSKYREMIIDDENSFTIKGAELIHLDKIKYLATVKIPSRITIIGREAFLNSPIKEVVLPEGIRIIGSCAFQGCCYLETINLPEGLQTIEDNGFEFCRNLKKVVLPAGLQYIGRDVFEHCSIKGEIITPARLLPMMGNPERFGRYNTIITISDLKDRRKGDFIVEGKNLLRYCGRKTEVIIPEGIKTISEWAFANCSIEKIVLPNGVLEIQNSAFFNCCLLKEVVFPDSLKKIGDGAFFQCTSIKKVILPDSLMEIGVNAFAFCFSLTELSIPPRDFGISSQYGLEEGCRIIVRNSFTKDCK